MATMCTKNSGLLMMINYGLVLYSMILEFIFYGILPSIYKISGSIMILYGLYVILVKWKLKDYWYKSEIIINAKKYLHL